MDPTGKMPPKDIHDIHSFETLKDACAKAEKNNKRVLLLEVAQEPFIKQCFVYIEKDNETLEQLKEKHEWNKSWSKGTVKGVLQGDLTAEKMKQIVQSIGGDKGEEEAFRPRLLRPSPVPPATAPQLPFPSPSRPTQSKATDEVTREKIASGLKIEDLPAEFRKMRAQAEQANATHILFTCSGGWGSIPEINFVYNADKNFIDLYKENHGKYDGDVSAVICAFPLTEDIESQIQILQGYNNDSMKDKFKDPKTPEEILRDSAKKATLGG